MQGWLQLARRLAGEGHSNLAVEVHRFVGGMTAPKTDQERIADLLGERAWEGREPTPVRSR